MAREKKQIILDNEAVNEVEKVQLDLDVPQKVYKDDNVVKISSDTNSLVNCLRNEKIIVRFIAKPKGLVTNPEHVLYGGMANGSKLRLTTPLLRSGGYVDVLTKNEKNYLEYKLGLEPNALSVHKREGNFWSDANEQGVGKVELIKGDNPFDLSNPIDYIKYKILLANRDIIAPSIQELQDRPKATYKFVIVNEDDTSKAATAKVNLKAQAYMEFGKINEDRYKMRIIIETIDGRPTAANSKLAYLQGRIGDLIESNTKTFLKVVKDPLLDNKILIKKAIEHGIIINRGNYLYLRDGNLPLCDAGQEPTLNIAANYLSHPRQQDLKFSIEAKVKD